MPVCIEHVGLHPRIDDHQHRKQRLTRLSVAIVGIGGGNNGPMLNYVLG